MKMNIQMFEHEEILTFFFLEFISLIIHVFARMGSKESRNTSEEMFNLLYGVKFDFFYGGVNKRCSSNCFCESAQWKHENKQSELL